MPNPQTSRSFSDESSSVIQWYTDIKHETIKSEYYSMLTPIEFCTCFTHQYPSAIYKSYYSQTYKGQVKVFVIDFNGSTAYVFPPNLNISIVR